MKKTARLINLLKSDCSLCTSCCREIMVELTDADIERLTKHTGITADKLVRLYSKPQIDSEDESDWIRLSYGKRALGLYKRRNGDCIFLKDDKTCAVYKSRPMTCRIFPVCVVFDDNHEVVDLEISEVIKDNTVKCERIKGNGRSYRSFMYTAIQLKNEHGIFQKKIDKWNSLKVKGLKNDFLNFLGFKTSDNGSR